MVQWGAWVEWSKSKHDLGLLQFSLGFGAVGFRSLRNRRSRNDLWQFGISKRGITMSAFLLVGNAELESSS